MAGDVALARPDRARKETREQDVRAQGRRALRFERWRGRTHERRAAARLEPRGAGRSAKGTLGVGARGRARRGGARGVTLAARRGIAPARMRKAQPKRTSVYSAVVQKKRAQVALITVCRTLPPACPRRTRCRSRPRQRRARRAVVTPAHPARACTGCRRHRSPARVPPRGCADGPRTAQRAAGQQHATALHVHAQARASTRADAQCPRPRVNAPVVRSANLQFLHLCVLGLGKANPHARAPPCRVSLLGQRHGAMRHMVEPHVGQERHAPLALLWRALLTNEQVAGGAVQ